MDGCCCNSQYELISHSSNLLLLHIFFDDMTLQRRYFSKVLQIVSIKIYLWLFKKPKMAYDITLRDMIYNFVVCLFNQRHLVLEKAM